MINECENMFRIIGIRVLRDCDERLRKILKPETTYFLCNDFEDDGDGGVRNKIESQPLDKDFFRTKKTVVAPNISISCVVGHNGDGKSSLMELFIRVINNFAFMSGFLSDHEDLVFIPGVHAKVFYQIDNDVCCLSCEGNHVQLTVNNSVCFRRVYGEDNMKQEKRTKRIFAENNAAFIFYTLVNNYSLYAYNSKEFQSETDSVTAEDSWIAALFHKNDAYQTPVVLSPQRIEGVINVNREYALSMQRLCELFFDCGKGKFQISNTEQAEGIIYKLEEGSKLISRTINDYLMNTNLAANNILRYYSGSKRKTHLPKRIINLTKPFELDFTLEFWDTFDKAFYDSGLLPLAKGYLESNVPDVSDPKKHNTDLYSYLVKVKTMAKRRNVANYSSSIENIDEFISKGWGNLTFNQFQRLFLVFEVYKQWLVELGSEEFRYFTALPHNPREHAIWYLIYKTIRILEYYPDFFSGGLASYQTPSFFFHKKAREHLVEKWFIAIKKDIEEQTHMTLKIRQTLYFLQHENVSSLLLSDEEMEDKDRRLFAGTDYQHYLDCAKYYEVVSDAQELSAALPPPIFLYDFVISRDNMSYYLLSRMSSGERQLLNSASAIVYHLKNLAKSKQQGTKILYNKINVILEEVELYFHPEYQRRFIKYLLDQIVNSHLPNTMAINLLFVTHSPFILSDIPRQNVLFLRDGSPDRSMQEDTFGANIHTLLQNGFFLNSVPIGEFAKEKIARLFEILNRSTAISQEELSKLGREIPLVSEPLLRTQLMRLYSQRKSFENGEYEMRIEALERKIQQLEATVNDNN